MLKKLLFKIVSLSLLFLPIYSAESEEENTEQVPISFVRDIMQPAGMPLVSFYHLMRENVFLNTRTPHTTPLEAMGNFFLTPNQYLFAGKTISFDGDNLLVSQVFSYDRLHWFKTLLCLISLPIAEPIGICLKGLAYLSNTTRTTHKSIVAGLKSPVVTSNREVYLAKGIESLHSKEFIPCQGHKRPSTLTKKQKVEIQALKEIVSLFEKHGIVYWIDFGTCLGAYRYGGIIPWDWDIDIAILEDDHDNVKRLLATLDKEQYKIQDWSSYTRPKSLLKLYVKETKNFLDIYHYRIDEEQKKIYYNYTFEDSPFPQSWKKTDLPAARQPLTYEAIFPLRKAKFDSLTVCAPNDVIEFLHARYGSNLDPAMVWDEELLTYTKVEDHPYWH